MIRRIRPVVIRVDKIENEIRRVIDEVLSLRDEWPGYAGGWVPLVDVREKGEELIVEAEVPGIPSPGIVVSLHPSRIVIRGAKGKETVEAGARYVRLERGTGSFQRTVPLPCAVRTDQAKATLENGVLTVRMKKLGRARTREVVVKVQGDRG
jgi:HSP20 family protein